MQCFGFRASFLERSLKVMLHRTQMFQIERTSRSWKAQGMALRSGSPLPIFLLRNFVMLLALNLIADTATIHSFTVSQSLKLLKEESGCLRCC